MGARSYDGDGASPAGACPPRVLPPRIFAASLPASLRHVPLPPDPSPMADLTTDTLDLSGLSEQEQLAFYGALFAVAAADDRIDEAESEQILEAFDLSGLSEGARERAFALSIAPPALQTCLDYFRDADAPTRHSLMLNLVDVALADGEIEPGEPMMLEQARVALAIEPEALGAMHAHVFRAREQAQKRSAPLARPLACPDDICQ